jgi:hypothetical protein
VPPVAEVPPLPVTPPLAVVPPVLDPPVGVDPPELLPPVAVVPPEPVDVPGLWLLQAPAKRARAPITERNRRDVIDAALFRDQEVDRSCTCPYTPPFV